MIFDLEMLLTASNDTISNGLEFVVTRDTKETLEGLEVSIEPLVELDVLIQKNKDATIRTEEFMKSLSAENLNLKKLINTALYYVRAACSQTHALESITSFFHLHYPYFDEFYNETV